MASRFFSQQDLPLGQNVDLEANVSTHLIKVLRHTEGEEIVLFNGDGYEYTATILKATKRALLRIDKKSAGLPASALKINLVQGISRGDRMDFSIQKAVELGVHSIQPVFSGKSKIRLDGARLSKKMQHWEAVVISACEQCGRSDMPTVRDAVSLSKVLEIKPDHPSLVLAFGEYPDLATVAAAATQELSILIGPESGLSEQEITQAVAVGWKPCQLGPRILRTETATITALAVIQLTAGDLRSPPL